MSEHKNPAIIGDLPSGQKGKSGSKKERQGTNMTGGRFYAKLAWTGIRNNRRFYLPYILTCAGMVAMYYIISYLTTSPILGQMKGGGVMTSILMLGCGVVFVFSLIFLFYTNSFLTKRRKKEFGLYNILGMGKRSLSWILCWESLIISVLSMIMGLFTGILLSKLAELVMINILQVESDFILSISLQAVVDTIKQFMIIFILLLLNMLYQVWNSNPMELLHSEQEGEKPPKVNWLLALVGIVVLAIAYYLAVSLEDPVQALLIFFVAVIMVIVATYLLFIAGSVALCRLLQKNKRYYYKANHFVSVSSMGYRMKRNGASLASICILCTMVLVMLMSTSCLYIGMEDSLRERYPRNIMFDISGNDTGVSDSEYARELRGLVEESAKEHGETVENVLDYSVVDFAGYGAEDKMYLSLNEERGFEIGSTWQMFVMSLDDYNRLAGTKETLSDGEALCYVSKVVYPHDTITLEDGGQAKTWKIKKQVEKFMENGVDSMQVMPSMYIIVPDVSEALAPWLGEVKESGSMLMQKHWCYGLDVDCDDEKQEIIFTGMSEKVQALTERMTEENGGTSPYGYGCECVAAERAGFYELYGGLFFLGIMLGLVFILAAVLMMYYKQISEGYEDQARFEIMQKVGMTKKQIRKSINSQVLTVFFLPLLAAVVHLAFSFPLVYKMLILFGFVNLKLLIIVTGICVLVFAMFYTLVYQITSKAYYSIVSSL